MTHFKPRSGAVCSVPGCERQLTVRNRSGVCQMHNHQRAYCTCDKCAIKRGQKPLPVPPVARNETTRGPLVQVKVPYATSNSGVAGIARVTLPAFPWEIDK